MTTPTALKPSAHHLLAEEGFARVVHLVQRDNDGVEEAFAVRIVDEALNFVAAATRATGRHLRPSKPVDLGWHALILHTAMYRELCTEGGSACAAPPEA
ncbi:hypothetical protein [Streptomyces sp. AB3(2024)]|uniref:hypothetical protein n=1 Tax=Streptomyces sp. AB3(2024) TaxID=3317321 RepID=UPI0035A397C2